MPVKMSLCRDLVSLPLVQVFRTSQHLMDGPNAPNKKGKGSLYLTQQQPQSPRLLPFLSTPSGTCIATQLPTFNLNPNQESSITSPTESGGTSHSATSIPTTHSFGSSACPFLLLGNLLSSIPVPRSISYPFEGAPICAV
jgi:hypothetical protein